MELSIGESSLNKIMPEKLSESNILDMLNRSDSSLFEN